MKSEGEKLVENLRGKNIFKNIERQKIEIEKVRRKNSINSNHTDSIPNWNKKDPDSVHVDMNHTNSNQINLSDSTKIGSILDSYNICVIENIFSSPLHYLVHVSPIFTYGSASDPPSPLHES